MAEQSNLPSLASATENQAMEYINNQALHHQYGLQVKLMNTLMQVTDVVTDLVAHFYQYVERSRAWQHVTYTNFEANFYNAQKITLNIKQHHIDMQKIKNRLVAT
ncbi:uncharacterized protein CIMG_13185 [Coccidioides immitis RS]|uniref:Uncharacterized protein n=1 Tax=Coccidioides immitis (strain RS) TaxID=246410 RepID=A0A0D8JTT0_COCIM|nr:uncharacterized protein CIMG_13185 [Coccidioides immitis RS]KJF60745.1 hypothetical protein CIMG_13185 [Coccidioides immitis RS]